MDDGESLVGVVGDAPGPVVDAVAAAGATVRTGEADDVLADAPIAVVAVGESAVMSVARTAPDVPVLPVDAGRGFRAVPPDGVESAVDALLAGEARTVSCPVLAVALAGDEVARAVTDVSLVTAEAAHISEYAVVTAGEPVEQFRADGVVVATPAGSAGYARRAGSPIVAPGTDVAAVTPVAPFATDPDHWILPLDDVRLRVARDEVAVELLADDRSVSRVGVDETVAITTAGRARIAVVPESRSRFS